MSSGLKTALYIVGSFLIFGLVFSLAVKLLFWALPVILVLVIFYYVKKFFDNKKNYKQSAYDKTNYTSGQDDINPISNEAVTEVIDVEYEDLN